MKCIVSEKDHAADADLKREIVTDRSLKAGIGLE